MYQILYGNYKRKNVNTLSSYKKNDYKLKYKNYIFKNYITSIILENMIRKISDALEVEAMSFKDT